MYSPGKGTRDIIGDDLVLFNNICDILKKEFILNNGTEIKTPIIERMDIVNNLYGEGFNKEVFKIETSKKNDINEMDNEIEDNPKEFLRYDLTVPFARVCAANSLKVFKRWQIGPAFRKDAPAFEKGRFREFTQADFDILGTDGGQQLQEIEILELCSRCLTKTIGDDFTIYVNSKKILYAVIKFVGISDDDFVSTCRSIDKLDKLTTDEVIKELIDERGISKETTNKLFDIITTINSYSNSNDKISKLIDIIGENDATSEIKKLFEVITSFGLDNKILFDISLSRGLDYYTGIIYEAKLKNKNIFPYTIASGGRYDEMMGKFSKKNVSIQCIGISFGIDRLLIIQKNKKESIKKIYPFVYVASVGKNMGTERIKLSIELRNKGIPVETNYKSNPKMRGQLDCVYEKIPYMIVIGENEIKSNTFNLKDINEEKEITVDRSAGISLLVKKYTEK